MPVRRMLILVLLVLLLPQHSAAAPPETRRLAAIGDAGAAVQTDGRYIVWAEPDAEGATHSIYAVPVRGGERITVAAGLPAQRVFDRMQIELAIDDGVVVWADQTQGQPAIRGRDLQTGELITVASGPVSMPGIADGTVTWWEEVDSSRGQRPDPLPATLKARRLKPLAEPVVVTQTSNSAFRMGPSLTSSGWVVWAKPSGINDTGLEYGLYAVPLSGGEPRSIGGTWSSGPLLISLSAGRVVYLRNGSPNPLGGSTAAARLFEVNLQSGAQHDLGPHGRLAALAVSERYIFWITLRSGPDSALYDLWGYDPASNSAFLIAGGDDQNAGYQPALDFAGGTLAWSWHDAHGSAIYTGMLDALLPSGRRPAPGAVGPEQIYFPETGHTLEAGFRGFWERSGGLPVFGYPLTEEFLERSADSEQGRATQYLERQRFEYHPEHAGTPYDVLLGRLGVDLLRVQGRDWTTLPKAGPSQPHYFAETGHAIAPQFYGYWASHGLEFGDPGVSFRESLALFGFPVSEPQLETNPDGDTVLTQWFERARFEYHPANPAEHRVLLGRLGVELLGQRGW